MSPYCSLLRLAGMLSTTETRPRSDGHAPVLVLRNQGQDGRINKIGSHGSCQIIIFLVLFKISYHQRTFVFYFLLWIPLPSLYRSLRRGEGILFSEPFLACGCSMELVFVNFHSWGGKVVYPSLKFGLWSTSRFREQPDLSISLDILLLWHVYSGLWQPYKWRKIWAISFSQNLTFRNF